MCLKEKSLKVLCTFGTATDSLVIIFKFTVRILLIHSRINLMVAQQLNACHTSMHQINRVVAKQTKATSAVGHPIYVAIAFATEI